VTEYIATSARVGRASLITRGISSVTVLVSNMILLVETLSLIFQHRGDRGRRGGPQTVTPTVTLSLGWLRARLAPERQCLRRSTERWGRRRGILPVRVRVAGHGDSEESMFPAMSVQVRRS
jgi:hypothetical protein